MADHTKIAVVGAASLRCGHDVLAAIFNNKWLPGTVLHLCDIQDEALDLFDRLARCFSDEQDAQLLIKADGDLEACVANATLIVLCFGLGGWRDALTSVSDDVVLEKARVVLLAPIFEQLNDAIYRSDFSPRIVNMVIPTKLTGQLLAHAAVNIDFPPALPESERIPRAHQILRVVRCDDYPGQVLYGVKDSPLVEIIRGTAGSEEDRFSPKALAVMLEEIEAREPGIRERLINLRS